LSNTPHAGVCSYSDIFFWRPPVSLKYQVALSRRYDSLVKGEECRGPPTKVKDPRTESYITPMSIRFHFPSFPELSRSGVFRSLAPPSDQMLESPCHPCDATRALVESMEEDCSSRFRGNLLPQPFFTGVDVSSCSPPVRCF